MAQYRQLLSAQKYRRLLSANYGTAADYNGSIKDWCQLKATDSFRLTLSDIITVTNTHKINYELIGGAVSRPKGPRRGDNVHTSICLVLPYSSWSKVTVCIGGCVYNANVRAHTHTHTHTHTQFLYRIRRRMCHTYFSITHIVKARQLAPHNC